MAMMCDFELRVAIIQAVSLNATHQDCYCHFVQSPITWVSFVSGVDLAGSCRVDLAGADIVKSRIDLVKNKDCINGSDPRGTILFVLPLTRTARLSEHTSKHTFSLHTCVHPCALSCSSALILLTRAHYHASQCGHLDCTHQNIDY